MNSRIAKATRAIFMLKRALSTNHNVFTGLALTLFDKMISPVLLFGCPLWSLPQINTVIKVQTSDIPLQNVKGWVISNLKELYPALNENSVKSIRTYRSKNEIAIEMENPMIKNCVLEQLAKRPLTFNIIACQDNEYLFEGVQSQFCKYVLGVSKYASTTLSLGELGRYPIAFKALTQTVLYWLRLEQGTDNFLLQRAYQECKTNEYDWFKQIRNFLQINGLGPVWLNVASLAKNYVKNKIKQRLQDQYIQSYRDYITSNVASGKTAVLDICGVGGFNYEMCQYMVEVNDPPSKIICYKVEDR